MFTIKHQYFLVFTLFMPVFCASPTRENEAQIVQHQYTNDGEGNYYFVFKTSNGISRDETGKIVNKGLPDEHISVSGYYSYTHPDGKLKIVYYKADDKGFSQFEPEEDIRIDPGPVLSTLLG